MSISERPSRLFEIDSVLPPQLADWNPLGIKRAVERWDEASQAFDSAIARFDELGSRPEQGRTLYQPGIMRGALGHTDTARADARRASALLEECGAQGDAEKSAKLFKDPQR